VLAAVSTLAAAGLAVTLLLLWPAEVHAINAQARACGAPDKNYNACLAVCGCMDGQRCYARCGQKDFSKAGRRGKGGPGKRKRG
jgi:hypothetical protein